MTEYEMKARELAHRAMYGFNLEMDKPGPANRIVDALLPMLCTSDLHRRALEACETMADSIGGMGSVQSINADYHRARNLAEAIGRESLAAKKPKGPWRVMKNVPQRAAHNDGRDIDFWMPRDPSAPNGPKIPDQAACAEWVREQNEREAAR